VQDLCRTLTEHFLKNSWNSVRALVERTTATPSDKGGSKVTFFRFHNSQKETESFDNTNFFLRGSVEYANPHLTIEEIQGVVGVRLLEVSANYFCEFGLRPTEEGDIQKICDLLKKPPKGRIVAFLLNTDDTEPDRYSMNPLRESLVSTGQSAFPAASVRTENLFVDRNFATKYDGTLISRGEIDLLEAKLAESNGSYLDFVDSVKYAQLEELSNKFGMDLSLFALRMPLTTLQAESKSGLLHHIVSETHRDLDAVKQAYDCMGRSITKRTTLLTIPHSKLGYGSKRAARGKMRFTETKLESVDITYKTTPLYPNDIDPQDLSIAKADDKFAVSGKQLVDYDFSKTPSSPQFFLYSLGSPENAALWHGVGVTAAPQLLQSCATARAACRKGQIIGKLESFGISNQTPMQFNLSPEGMWVHPVHCNIDASVGCVTNLADLAQMGMRIEHLPKFEQQR